MVRVVLRDQVFRVKPRVNFSTHQSWKRKLIITTGVPTRFYASNKVSVFRGGTIKICRSITRYIYIMRYYDHPSIILLWIL